MKGSIHYLNIGGRKVSVYLPKDLSTPIPAIYLFAGEELRENPEALISPIEKAVSSRICTSFALIAPEPVSWESDYTPWYSHAAYKNGNDFTGEADKTLVFVKNELIPFIKERFPYILSDKNIATGYSLGGLFALWSAVSDDIFYKAASVSGSLWFPGFLDFFKEKSKAGFSPDKVYLSLGKKELSVKNPVMAKNGAITEEIYSWLKRNLGDENTIYILNNGGHFTDVPKRMADAMIWLMSP